MKAIPAPLQAHLNSGTTTMCYCWRVTRNDGEIQGFTEHDRDLVFGGTTYLASAGFTASTIQSSLGMSVDNLNVDSALSSESINEEDLASGMYDDAEVLLYWVNWQDPDQRILMSRGFIGEVSRGETSFSAELRSLSQKAQQTTGRTYARYCDANLGDDRCRVALEVLKRSGSVTTATSRRAFSVSVSGSAVANEYFALGLIRFTSGPNSGLTLDVKNHTISGGSHHLTLWSEAPYPLDAGTTFEIYPGCKKDIGTCHTKFANRANFQGFNLMPGNGMVAKYPTAGLAGQDGRSLFNRVT